MWSSWIHKWQLSACQEIVSSPNTSVERMLRRSQRFTFSFALRTGATSASRAAVGSTSLLPNWIDGSASRPLA